MHLTDTDAALEKLACDAAETKTDLRFCITVAGSF